MVGQILKKMYIDSALKQEEHIDQKDQKAKQTPRRKAKNISWREFKKLNEE